MDKREQVEFKLNLINEEIQEKQEDLERLYKLKNEVLEEVEQILDYTIFLQ